jgi:hypothetical protein
MTILMILAGIICIGGKYSSKNVSGQHRRLLSFYAITGIADVLAIWMQLIFTVWQYKDSILHAVIPAVALVAYYFLNIQWNRLWKVLDPPKPKDDDELTKKECLLINECDMHFDQWNEKYFKVADIVHKIVIFLSHKFFMMPYTHFFGYLHLTVRIQDNRVMWQWDVEQWTKWQTRRLSVLKVKRPEFQFKGRLVSRLVGDDDEVALAAEDHPPDKLPEDEDLQQEDKGCFGQGEEGAFAAIFKKKQFNPYKYV